MDRQHMSNGRLVQRENQKPCRFIFQPGGCRYGAKCKFSHSNAAAATSVSSLAPSRNNARSVQEKAMNGSIKTEKDGFIQWRYSIPLNTSYVKPLGPRLSNFFQTALELLEHDHGVMQEVVLSLASEGGLARVKELLDQDFDVLSDLGGVRIVQQQILPFSQIITHENVMASIMLEEKVGSIFNLLYGRTGERGVKLFAFLVRVLAITESSELRQTSVLRPILALFSSMVDMNSHALVNPSLPSIADVLCSICTKIDDTTSLQLQKLITRIRRQLKVGLDLQHTQDRPKSMQQKAKFIVPQDPPGRLSSRGPRHDNDHADIKSIKILPTYAEITATRPPYLPPQDTAELHLPGVQGLLDRHFRLLREDTVGQLRDAIGAELNRDDIQGKNAARIHTYENLVVVRVSFTRRNELQLLVQIDQPQHLRKLTTQARKEWWENTTRLRPEALVCIIGEQKSVTFCNVSQLFHASDTKADNKAQNGETNVNMYNNPDYCYFQLQIVNDDSSTVSNTLSQLMVAKHDQKLVEFPGVLLPSFLPTLQALQKMSKRGELPFSGLLAPDRSFHSESDDLGPPLYASKPDFQFDLRSVMGDKSPVTFKIGQSFDLENFKLKSELDDAQAEALIDCLGRSLALIQGPPGTGKSFTGVALIKVLLAIKQKAKLGPIICVCYTNHALDQLLEHLVRNNVPQIIRMGSRSKSEVLEKCNLRTVAYNMPMTGPEKKARWETLQQLDAEEGEIQDLLRILTHPENQDTIKFYLETHHPDHHDYLFGSEEDEDGFQTVRHDKHNEIKAWLNGGRSRQPLGHSFRPIGTLRHCKLNQLNHDERRTLYNYWIGDIKQITQEKFTIALDSFKSKKTQLDGIRHGQDLRCLEEANIIGVTTTGLARQLDLLRNLRSKVLICEEAGEVLEAHILTALLPSLQQAILIGDHLQLPPHIQNYDLSRASARGVQYSLDVSLFERLVTPDPSRPALPFSVLETQRRMHPSISALIRSTLYPALKDFPDVASYPNVAGMKKRLFWFDHQEPEAGFDSNHVATTSHSNDFEIKMVVSLVTHLVRQGVYAANDIAVLTPYLGQLHKIRKVLRNHFEITMNERDIQEIERQGIADDSEPQTSLKTTAAKTTLLKALAVSTIDNFQGEEAKVVVISLVRSNSQNKCGFLKTSNRINVLLSRAKHGMYIIGNSQTSSHVKMWADVICMLQENGNIGPQLELECPRHPEIPIFASKPDDFVILSPEGGCDKKCDQRLNCGHRCQQKCHSQVLHNAVKCLEPCPRQLDGCDHGCPKQCGDQCVKLCQVMLTDLEVRLECGHVKNTLPCWQKQNPSTVRCQTVVSKVVPGCGHEVRLDCCTEPASNTFKCNAVCGALLECGHQCKKKCFECRPRREGTIISTNHGKCKLVCGKKFNSCSHSCRLECHGQIPCECTAPCDNFCEHSRCGKPCKEPCAPCANITCATSRCPHTEMFCSMPCSAPCDWLPCAKRCEKILECGHQCPTVCGEVCPPSKFCQTCASQDVKDIVVDFILMSSYGDVELDEDPCIIPVCGHILTISNMDNQMEMSKHYHMDGNVVTGLKDSSNPFSMDELKICATCRGSLRNVARYGRIVRRALLDESTKKFIRWAGLQTISLTERLHEEQRKLADSLHEAQKIQQPKEKTVQVGEFRKQQIEAISSENSQRYKTIRKLQVDIARHLEKVQIQEQPYKRVWDLVQHAKRQSDRVGHMQFDTSILQTRETLQTTALLLRCDIIILSDFFALHKGELKVNLNQNRAESENLVKLATEANQPLHIVEGHMFYAQFCAAERPYVDVGTIDKLMEDAKNHVAEARKICQEYPGSTHRVVSELDDVEKMLRGSTFYAPVRDDEWGSVMAAMAREFRGSGHWYTCRNGHPFTIGECGMAMQRAKCPQCDAPIGGQNHQSAEGVRHAGDLERRFANMGL